MCHQTSSLAFLLGCELYISDKIRYHQCSVERVVGVCHCCKTDRGPPYLGARHVPNFVRNSYMSTLKFTVEPLVTVTWPQQERIMVFRASNWSVELVGRWFDKMCRGSRILYTRNYRDDGKGDVSCNILLLYYRSGKIKDHDLNRSSTTLPQILFILSALCSYCLRLCTYFLHYSLLLYTQHSDYVFFLGPVQVRFRSHYLKFGLQVLLMEEILPTRYV